MAKEESTLTPQEVDEHSLKTTKIVTAIAAVMLVFIVGYTVGAATDSATNTVMEQTVEESHSHAGDGVGEGEGRSHSHEQYEVTDGELVPAITDLSVEKDAKSGWNVSFQTENFEFTPGNVNSDHIPGEGHAHIYVDSQKVNRLYSNNYHLGELTEGERDIRITLNTNAHSEYTVDGETINATTTAVDTHHSN